MLNPIYFHNGAYLSFSFFIFTGFKVLNELERTTALYTLLQHSSPDQLQFFLTVIQKKIQPPEELKPKTSEHVLIAWIGNSLSCNSSTPRWSDEAKTWKAWLTSSELEHS